MSFSQVQEDSLPTRKTMSGKLTLSEKTKRTYFGMAGQHFAMSEFLERGYNVAIPEVDVGDDVIVIKDELGNLTRVQVKSTNLTKKEKDGKTAGYATCVTIRRDQLYTQLETTLYYFMPFRFDDRWQTMLIIEQTELKKLHEEFIQRTKDRKRDNSEPKILALNFAMDQNFKSIKAWGASSFDSWRENWSKWPARI